MNYILDYLEELEAEAIYILREVYEQFENSCLMFSGGKDSIVLIHLAKKAFYPTKIPFKILHIDSGHNFHEIIEFREKLIKNENLDLIVASVEDYARINDYSEKEFPDRNRLQIPVLLDIIKKENFDAAIGGGRRDEEKARAKERVFSHRNIRGQWDPENQRPELWNIYNGNKKEKEHFRIFPLSNWTELDIWHYIKKERIEIPAIYFSHKRKVIITNGIILAASDYSVNNYKVIEKKVRCRTVGDINTTGLWESEAKTIDDIIKEISVSGIGERGKRTDDKFSITSMEDRKRKGYF